MSSNQTSPSALSRRSLLKAAAATTASLVAAPMILAEDKAPAKNAIVGEGAFKYECLHDWTQLPSGHSYGGASHGSAFDTAGNLYIAHLGGPGSVFVFDPDGKFIRSMLAKYNQGGASGHGIEVRKEGGEEFLYLSYNAPKRAVVKANLKGDVVWEKGFPKESGKYKDAGGFNPTNISFTPDGGFHVGDGYGSHWIHRYDKDANYVSTFGGHGKDKGKFITPHGNCLDTRDGTPKLIVADRANARLQYVSLDGEHISFVEEKGQDGNMKSPVLFPADIDIQGDIMLVPDLHARITLFDKNNKVITHLGEDPAWRKTVLDGFKMRGQREKWQPGKFIHPHDAKFDKDGNIIVAEWVNTGRVTKLKKLE